MVMVMWSQVQDPSDYTAGGKLPVSNLRSLSEMLEVHAVAQQLEGLLAMQVTAPTSGASTSLQTFLQTHAPLLLGDAQIKWVQLGHCL